MDTSEAQLVHPTVAGEILELQEQIANLREVVRRLAADVADSMSIRIGAVQCERDVVPPLALTPGPRLTLGDAVVADLAMGGLIKGKVVGFVLVGDRITVDGGKQYGVVTVDAGRVMACPGWWV